MKLKLAIATLLLTSITGCRLNFSYSSGGPGYAYFGPLPIGSAVVTSRDLIYQPSKVTQASRAR